MVMMVFCDAFSLGYSLASTQIALQSIRGLLQEGMCVHTSVIETGFECIFVSKGVVQEPSSV